VTKNSSIRPTLDGDASKEPFISIIGGKVIVKKKGQKGRDRDERYRTTRRLLRGT